MKGRCNTSGENVKAEVEYQTPVITQIAENLGVTITTPSGTNKQILQGNNTNLLNIKNNAKKEGLYVWKRSIPAYYEFPETAVEKLTLINSSSSTESCTVYYGDEFSYDETAKEYTLVSSSSITVQYSSYEDIELLKNKYFTTSGSATASNLYKGTDSTTGSTSTVLGRTYSVYVNNLVELTASRVEEVFQNFATADDFAKYPDKAVHTDGYWYELFDSSVLIPENIKKGIDIWGVVGTGGATVKNGTVTFSSTTTNPVLTTNIAHGLGVKPTVFGLNKVVIKYNGDRSAVTHTINVTANATNLVVKLSDNNTSDWDTTMTSLSWYAGV